MSKNFCQTSKILFKGNDGVFIWKSKDLLPKTSVFASIILVLLQKYYVNCSEKLNQIPQGFDKHRNAVWQKLAKFLSLA